jgi:hypothetical protein
MRNVAPSIALARRSRRLLEIAFIVVVAGVFLTVVGIALYVVPFTASAESTSSVFDAGRGVLFLGGIIAALVGVGLSVRAFTWKTENDLALQTGEALEPYLDNRFVFIRNVSRIALGYIDAVLVGPSGVLVFRILDLRGEFLNEGDKWLRRPTGKNWTPMFTNPTEEVIEDIKSLQEYFARRGITDVPMFGVVVFVEPPEAALVTTTEPVVPVTHLTSLHTTLQRNYLAAQRIDQATVTAIVRTLYNE